MSNSCLLLRYGSARFSDKPHKPPSHLPHPAATCGALIYSVYHNAACVTLRKPLNYNNLAIF